MTSTWRALLDAVAHAWREAPPLAELSAEERRREARLLVAAVAALGPGQLAARLDDAVDAATERRVIDAAARRATGEPLAYCTGTAAFRTLVLQVDARVLIPRPETELVVEEALALARARPGGVAIDIGTGSGAIALSLAAEGAFERVVATDLSADALDVARANRAALPPGAAPVELRLGADLAPVLGERARVLVSNPPYIAFKEAEALPASVRDWEPPTALFAADGGMARYEALLREGRAVVEPGGWLVLEVDARRADDTAALAGRHGWTDIRIRSDYSGRDRILVARAPITDTTPSGP